MERLEVLGRAAIWEVFMSQDMRATSTFLCDRKQRPRWYRPLAAFFVMLDLLLRGVSQVYICDHPLCGLLIALAVGLTSGELLLHCLLGVLASTVSGFLLCRLPLLKIKSGLLGFDGALVGCTGWQDHGRRVVAVLLAALSGIMHMTCANVLALAKLPPFTTAFNLVCLVMLATCAAQNINAVALRSTSDPPAADPAENYTDMSPHFLLDATLRGVGQFIFADSTLGSALVVLADFPQGRHAALCLLLGSLTACLTARYLLQVPPAVIVAIRQGLYGYNSAGVCVVLGGGRFHQHQRGHFPGLRGRHGHCLRASGPQVIPG
jgi:urea transporter